MSIGGSLSGITFGGISSGLDTNSIIERLIQIESFPIQRLQFQQQEVAGRQGILGQFRSKLNTLSTVASGLNIANAFNPLSASSSNSSVATVTAGGSAAAGTYNLSVSKLAQAHKVASAAQASVSDALDLSGYFVLNGKAVEVTASDSLTEIAQKINGAGSGLTASIIDGGANNAFLTLTSNSTGASSKIQMADVEGGTVLADLGLIAGAAVVREPIGDGAASYTFSSSTTPISNLLGISGMANRTIQINGTNVAIDPNSDSLQTLASAITVGVPDVVATVETVTTNGTTRYRLEITGTSGTPTFVDDAGILGSLGVLQAGYGSQLVTAQDAEFSIDGVSLTSASNTVTTAVPGATITLLKGNPVTPETATLTLARDNAAIVTKLKEFLNAYNDVMDFVKTNSQFDKDTFQSGPLFGDPVAQQVEFAVSELLFRDVAAVSGQYKNLAAIGFGTESNGKLKLDESILANALSTAAADVAELFQTVGKGSVGTISYVSSTARTRVPGTGAYTLDITQLATFGSYTGETAQTLASAAIETLTFSGSMFAGPYSLILPIGSTAADTVALINNDATLRNLVTASLDGGGKLAITSKRYGTPGDFTVVSDLAAAPDTSGIGTSSAGTVVAGLNVEGTIGGEPATGSGQFLTGDADNEFTSGLQIQYTGNQTGIVGTIRFTKGMAAYMSELMQSYTDSVNGLLTATDQSLQKQIDDMSASIKSLQERLTLKQQTLRRRFAQMEQAMATLQAQAQRLSQVGAPQSG